MKTEQHPPHPLSPGAAVPDALPIDTQVDNVLSGKSADGVPLGKPIPFPEDVHKRYLLIRWANAFPSAADEIRTAYIGKLARYLARRSPPLLHTDVHDGMRWLIDHPVYVCTPLRFATAVRRARETFARECKAAQIEERGALQQAMDEPMPAPPVLHDDGTHALQEIIHPRQMMIIGLAAMNCLARKHRGQYRCNVRYWSLVAQKRLRMFALCKRAWPLCVFSVTDGLIREWQYAVPPTEVIPVLPAFLAALERETGPLDPDHAIITFAGEFFDIHKNPSRTIRQALEASRDRF